MLSNSCLRRFQKNSVHVSVPSPTYTVSHSPGGSVAQSGNT